MAVDADLVPFVIKSYEGRYQWFVTVVRMGVVCAATKHTFSVGVVVDKDWLLHLADYLLVVR